MERLHIFLTANLERLLRKHSEKTGLPMSEIVRTALIAYFNNQQ